MLSLNKVGSVKCIANQFHVVSVVYCFVYRIQISHWDTIQGVAQNGSVYPKSASGFPFVLCYYLTI